METKRSILQADMIARVEQLIKQAKALQDQPLDRLNQQPAPKRWSVLECLEHLNRYGLFYLPLVKENLEKAKPQPEATVFKSGLIGGYAAKGMEATAKQKNMKTFASKDPAGSALDKKVLDVFLEQQKEWLRLLQKAGDYDWQRIRMKTTLPIPFLKFRLGDIFRFLIHHQERHMRQAQRALEGK